MHISEAIQEGAEILKNGGIAEALRESSSLLAYALRKDKTFLIAHPEYELTADEKKIFREFIARRATREPLQYITGRQEFFGLEFIVTPEVLIPRPETELLVEEAIGILQSLSKPVFCEIGVGSGCISVSILHNLPSAAAIGVDISNSALQMAVRNSEKHNIKNRLTLERSDVFDIFDTEKFDLVISNPPYVPEKDLAALQAEVRDFEPRVALAAGSDGLSVIKKLIDESPNFLKESGFLLMEIGFDQDARVRELFDEAIWQSIKILPDLQGIPRMVKAQAAN